MTEQEWLKCTDPTPMLEFLKGKATDRKLRLFAVAYCRRNWHLLVDERSRKAVELGELYADELVSEDECASAERGADDVVDLQADCFEEGTGIDQNNLNAAIAAANVVFPKERVLAWGPTWVLDSTPHLRQHPPNESDLIAQTMNLRCIFGQPFRTVTLDPSWLHWNDGTIPKLAQAIYDDRTFDRLPILADALEGVGCDNAEVLAHCRGPGPHVRGCWVVDLILGKE